MIIARGLEHRDWQIRQFNKIPHAKVSDEVNDFFFNCCNFWFVSPQILFTRTPSSKHERYKEKIVSVNERNGVERAARQRKQTYFLMGTPNVSLEQNTH